MQDHKTTTVRLKLTEDEQKRIKRVTGKLIEELDVPVAKNADKVRGKVDYQVKP